MSSSPDSTFWIAVARRYHSVVDWFAATHSHYRIGAPKKDLLSFLMKPWVDKAVAAVSVVPFVWLTYVRFRAFGVDLPRLVFAIHMLVFITTMVTRKTPVRVSTNPWYWLLTFVETYWGVLTFGLMSRGRVIAPHWMSDSLAFASVGLLFGPD